MKTLNQLLFLTFFSIVILKTASAQINSNQIIIGNDQVASSLNHNTNGIKPDFVNHYNNIHNNFNNNDTGHYIVDATSHLKMDDVADTVDHISVTKMDIIIALNAALKYHDILFDYNDYRLTNSSKNLLDQVSAVMLQYPDAVFEIGGHADARGIYADNLVLTERRVEAAIDYLVSKGVNRKQLKAVAYGETVLKNVCDSDSHCTEEVHASNRRIEIKLISVGKQG